MAPDSCRQQVYRAVADVCHCAQLRARFMRAATWARTLDHGNLNECIVALQAHRVLASHTRLLRIVIAEMQYLECDVELASTLLWPSAAACAHATCGQPRRACKRNLT